MGEVGAGKTIEVELDRAANIRLLDFENFKLFKQGLPHEFVGGFIRFTPYRIVTPKQAHWVIVADLGGTEGEVSASYKIYPTDRIPKMRATRFE
jgi:hypothetical protein